MEIALIIYFGINLFMTGYFLNDNLRWESKQHSIIFAIVCLFFGALFAVFIPLFYLFSPISSWIYNEIKFWYRFKFTDYWDKVLLDDTYSEEYKTREEKLERVLKLANYFNKQSKRHSKLVYNKYKI